MKINDVAKLAGVSVRTLHYYDKIGILHPQSTTEVGYRIYGTEELSKLQQILFFKELEFELGDIKNILESPNFDEASALKNQKALLLQKRSRLDNLIALVDNTLKGEENMSFKEFDMTEIETAKKKYATEVKERWGGTDAHAESEKKTGAYSSGDWQNITAQMSGIFDEFAENMDKKPDDEAVQALVKKWQEHISHNFYNCTNEILSGLGEMYVRDERFTANIDRTKAGLAKFISGAIAAYCAVG